VGISCGCYAKFHRQVAHIHDNMVMRQSDGDKLPPKGLRDA
jgi:hypothetical protein